MTRIERSRKGSLSPLTRRHLDNRGTTTSRRKAVRVVTILRAPVSSPLTALEHKNMAWQVLRLKHPYMDMLYVLLKNNPDRFSATPGYPAIWDMICDHYGELLALDKPILRALADLSNEQRWRARRRRPGRKEDQLTKGIRAIVEAHLSHEQEREKLKPIESEIGAVALRGRLSRIRKKLSR